MTKKRKSVSKSSSSSTQLAKQGVNKTSNDEVLLLSTSRNLQQEIRDEIDAIFCIYEPSVCKVYRLVPVEEEEDDSLEENNINNDSDDDDEAHVQYKLVPVVNYTRITNFDHICMKLTLYRHDDEVQQHEEEGGEDTEESCPSSGRITLVVQFVQGYPLRPPIVSLENVKGLSEDQVKELMSIIQLNVCIHTMIYFMIQKY
jgi:hypothetical protein